MTPHGVTVRFEVGDGELTVPYTVKEARAQLGLAFATTVHKAQGSEWPVVVVVRFNRAPCAGCVTMLANPIVSLQHSLSPCSWCLTSSLGGVCAPHVMLSVLRIVGTRRLHVGVGSPRRALCHAQSAATVHCVQSG